MKYIIVDIEADGPTPEYSMLSLGACTLNEPEDTFYVEIAPHSRTFVPETVEWLQDHGLNRDALIEKGSQPQTAMMKFDRWLTNVAKGDRLRLVSDNAGFDWMFVCYYFHRYLGRNPFGFSPVSLTSLYAGFAQDIRKANEYKKWRLIEHSHNALDDARGNANAMRRMMRKGMKF